MKISFFKSKKITHRFRENQKVWIRYQYGNHLDIVFRWRGKGRYVGGRIDRERPEIGEIHTIEVDDEFGRRMTMADWEREAEKRKKAKNKKFEEK
jgi:hypothetical protein